LDPPNTQLTGLWKQATEGDCKEPEPKDKKAAKEHDAWASHKGMNQDDAKNKYVAALKKALKEAEGGDSKTLLDQIDAAA
jgi:acyl-CoA-binding protein